MKHKPLKIWTGPIDCCDICASKLNTIFIDGKTLAGPWAIMCGDCFLSFGIKIGVGFGQAYVLTKIAGQKYWVDKSDLVDTVNGGNRKA